MKTTCARTTCFRKTDTELNAHFCFEHYLDLELEKERKHFRRARINPVVSHNTRARRFSAKVLRPGVVQIVTTTHRQLLT